jgi:hypothetical protein
MRRILITIVAFTFVALLKLYCKVTGRPMPGELG